MLCEYDLFFSYARSDSADAKPLVAALEAQGLRVWFDQTDIADFESISRSVKNGLANSKALFAYFSRTYPTRRGCQYELAAAFLAGQREGDSRKRIFVVNPEPANTHIFPVHLRDALHRNQPPNADPTEMAAVAGAVHAAVAKLQTNIGEVTSKQNTQWYG